MLGSIVNGQLTTNLHRRLASIPGLPAAFRNEVIAAVTTGSVDTGVELPKTGPIARIVNEVLAAADNSFSRALNVVLVSAGVLLLVSAGVAAAALVRGRRASLEDF